MRFSFTRGVAACALVALALLAACAPAAGPDATATPVGGQPSGASTTGVSGGSKSITIVDNQFETGWINNAIYRFIVEKGYEGTIDEVVLGTPAMQVALQKGDVDLMLEIWPGNFQEWWEEQTKNGTVKDLGDMYEGGDQFFFVQKSVADANNIRTIEDMKRPEVVKLFPDPEDSSKGAFINCPLDWQCAEINRAKLQAYGLDKYYNIVSPGSSGAMDAAIVGAAKKNQPVFAYYWAPTSIAGAYDWRIIKEPTYTKECWAEVQKGQNDKSYTPKQACAYETVRVIKGVHKTFESKIAAEIVEFTKKMNTGIDGLNKTAAWAAENDIQGKWEKAAVYYLKTFEDRWKAWVPEDVYRRVKAALP